MRLTTSVSFVLALLYSTYIQAEGNDMKLLRDQAETQILLNGSKMEGIYLRTQSPYSLEFHQDGTLINQRGDRGRWWANQQGQYCRKWETGSLKGHQMCLNLAHDGDAVTIFSGDKKVAEGVLVRK